MRGVEDIDLNTLLHNLAIAGALCAAFSHGRDPRFMVIKGARVPWKPGCGRKVPQ